MKFFSFTSSPVTSLNRAGRSCSQVLWVLFDWFFLFLKDSSFSNYPVLLKRFALVSKSTNLYLAPKFSSFFLRLASVFEFFWSHSTSRRLFLQCSTFSNSLVSFKQLAVVQSVRSRGSLSTSLRLVLKLFSFSKLLVSFGRFALVSKSCWSFATSVHLYLKFSAFSDLVSFEHVAVLSTIGSSVSTILHRFLMNPSLFRTVRSPFHVRVFVLVRFN